MAEDETGFAWVPPEEVRDRSRYLAAVRKWGLPGDADGVSEANRRAIADPEWFWRAVVEDLDVAFAEPFERVLDESEGKPFPRWFAGGRVNVAELCAHRHARGELAGKTAVVYEGDSGQRRTLTFGELDE
ncbi:MAG TPA: acetyl-coenzyme A synthetase N-terminal domain-containing protein, partial [Streptomyces sp.]